MTEVYVLDLKAGWEAAQLAHQARQWGAMKVVMPLEATDDALAADMAPADTGGRVPGIGDPGPGGTAAELDLQGLARLRQRVEAIVNHSPKAKKDLARLWPRDVPTFKHGGPTCIDEADEIEGVVQFIEHVHKVPFVDYPEGASSSSAHNTAAPRPSAPEEGDKLTLGEVNRIKAALAELTPERQERVRFYAGAAHEARLPVTLVNNATERRGAIAWALIELSRLSYPQAESVLAMCFGLMEVDYGQVIGSMTIGQAVAVRELARMAEGQGDADGE